MSKSGFSTELVSDTGRPEVETLGLVPGLNRPELSTKNNSLELLPLGDGEEFFSCISEPICKKRPISNILKTEFFLKRYKMVRF